MLVQDDAGEERSVYFVSKVLKGAEIRFHKIEWLALVVVVTVRKLKKYFQGHPIIVKTNYRVKRILKKPHLAGRMMA